MKNGKFEVGDKVRYVNDSIGSFYEREPLVMKKVYTVSGFFSTGGDLLLKEITNKNGFGYCPSRFELVKDEKAVKDSFKVGDKVRCVDNGGASALEIGEIYTVVKVDSEFVHIDNNGGYYPRRFEIVKEEKKKAALPAAFSITFNGNKILWETIQKIAFENGFCWASKGVTEIEPYASYGIMFISLNTKTWEKKRLYTNTHCYQDYPTYDVVKDFAKIVELLRAAPTKPTMEAPKVNGYVMEYKKGDLTATFGCAKISISFMRDVSRMMAEDYEGNRKLDAIVLDSGVKLTKDDVSNIIKYVDFVNKNS